MDEWIFQNDWLINRVWEWRHWNCAMCCVSALIPSADIISAWAVRECRCQVVLISSKSLSQLCTPGDKTSPTQPRLGVCHSHYHEKLPHGFLSYRESLDVWCVAWAMGQAVPVLSLDCGPGPMSGPPESPAQAQATWPRLGLTPHSSMWTPALSLSLTVTKSLSSVRIITCVCLCVSLCGGGQGWVVWACPPVSRILSLSSLHW